MAAAYAEQGRFTEAAKTAKKGMIKAEKLARASLVTTLQEQAAAYRSGKIAPPVTQ